jgi:NAD(P)-dependent dehydrogenase (short-subunit alcohol dehydrogenase family)
MRSAAEQGAGEPRDQALAETVARAAARQEALDVTDIAGIDRFFSGLGRLDILVNNAGIEDVRPSLEMDEALWDRILDTNLKGAFFCAQAAARLMQANGPDTGGSILNLCSLTSEVGVPTAVPYGASKSGLLGMTRALSAEWASLGIRVNGIGPGYFRTSLTEVFYRDEAWQAAMRDKIPLRRFGRMEDLMGAAVFLCSPPPPMSPARCSMSTAAISPRSRPLGPDDGLERRGLAPDQPLISCGNFLEADGCCDQPGELVCQPRQHRHGMGLLVAEDAAAAQIELALHQQIGVELAGAMEDSHQGDPSAGRYAVDQLLQHLEGARPRLRSAAPWADSAARSQPDETDGPDPGDLGQQAGARRIALDQQDRPQAFLRAAAGPGARR